MPAPHVPTGMRRGRVPRGPVRSGPWLVGLSLVAIACTSTPPDAARGSSSAGATTSSSPGWDARTTIAFHADPGGRDDTYVMDAAGAHVVAVTDGIETVAQPIWSPDGERLLLTCCTSGFGRLLLSDGPGTPSSTSHRMCRISPTPLVAGRPRGRVRIEPRTGCCTSRTSEDGHAGRARPLGVSGAAPSWSPDGTHLHVLRGGRREPRHLRGGCRRIGHPAVDRDAAPEYSPVWSPDGEHIAFISERDGDQDVIVMRCRRHAPDRCESGPLAGRHVRMVAGRTSHRVRRIPRWRRPPHDRRRQRGDRGRLRGRISTSRRQQEPGVGR